MDFENMITSGALMSIIKNEKVEGLILQVIDVGKSLISGYTLIISDGENIISVGMAANLNSMVFTRKLTKFAIIKINNYITTNVIQPAKEPRQVIMLSDLVVLVHGFIVCRTIGNPRPIIIDIESILGTEASTYSAVQVNEEFSELRTKQELWKSLIGSGQYSKLLTTGALQSIINYVDVKYPVMQVLNIRQVTNSVSGNGGYCLTISDGQHFFSLAKLGNRLNNMITYGFLTKSSIIYIRSYAVSNIQEVSRSNKLFIILTDLVCLLACPGAIFGDPKPYNEHSGEIVENSIPTSTHGGPERNEPIVEMGTSAPPTAQEDLDNVLLNLDMLHIL